MATAVCPGVIVTDVNGVPACEDMMGAPLMWEQIEAFTTADIEAEVASGFFAAGFVLVGVAWAIGRSCRAFLDIIRR